MKKERNHLLALVILYALGAVIWISDCVRTLSYGQMGFLQFLATAVFTAAFIIYLRRYLRSRAEENENKEE